MTELLSTRLAVAFPATQHQHLLAGTKLYYLVTLVCKQLAEGHYMKVEWLGVNPQPLTALTITPAGTIRTTKCTVNSPYV